MRSLYIENPLAYLFQNQRNANTAAEKKFASWLRRRLEGNTKPMTCRVGSFFQMALEQYEALRAYYRRGDLTAPVPQVRDMREFLLAACKCRVFLVLQVTQHS